MESDKNIPFPEKNTSPSSVHPTFWIRESKGKALSGKTIVLGVTGSIAAVQTVQLARELIRYGASVYAVATTAALSIIHEDALHYATGNPIIKSLTGRVEHVEFFGANGYADLLLIAPATANTVSKIAAGIDDTTVTTFATTAIGEGKNIMIVPAMHESMYRHPKVLENLKVLESWGIEIIDPHLEEGIAKIADTDEIVLRVLRTLGDYSLAGNSVFVTSGATAESIDPIRILTNRASGKTGDAVAREAYIRGAEVYLFHRNVSKYNGLPHFHDIFTESCRDMTDAVTEKIALADPPKSGQNILISTAAISDYTIDADPSKIKSGASELTLKLRPTKKLIEEACYTDPNLFIVGFKAETGISLQELINTAALKIEEGITDMVVANDVKEKGMGTADNDVYLVTKDYLKTRNLKSVISISGSKEKIAAELFDYVVSNLSEDTGSKFVFPKQQESCFVMLDLDTEIQKSDLNESDPFDFYSESAPDVASDVLSDFYSDVETESAGEKSNDATLSTSKTKRNPRKKPARINGNVFKKRN